MTTNKSGSGQGFTPDDPPTPGLYSAPQPIPPGIFLDLLALLGELLRHCGHLCSELRLLRLECLHLRPIRHSGYLPQNVSGPTIAKCPAHSASDVLQFEVLVLEMG